MSKVRLDVEMVKRGLSPSREKARAEIMAGEVRVNGVRAEKAGQEIPEEAEIVVVGEAIPFVSRGGLKLDKAVKVFSINLEGRVCADIGASTGGFTDVMLQNGASHVYAIDVGYGQLDWKLRNDDRVTVMERTNARNMAPDWFDQKVTFASIDVSFISLKLILPPLYQCLEEEGEVVALIKPQFEAGRNEVGKNGVIRDCSVHARICEEIMRFASNSGYAVKDLSYSPITGPKGNIEFLLYMQKSSTKNIPDEPDFQLLAQKTAESAHKTDAFLKS
ncbi:MAG: TlyA family RNA methyltransferase [Clostridia bacterium]|nr:TlyA family RNA methyltransferase [Clostridia bacterium]